MLSGMARRAAKSVLAASQDELGSSSSNREEKETEQGEEAGTVSKGVSRQMSGPRKSGLAAAERSSALESSAEKETPSKRDGDKDTQLSNDSDPESVQDDSDDIETGAVPQLDGADEEGKKDKKEDDKTMATTTAGVKRGRGSTSGNSGAPPTKTMQLSTGEKVSTSTTEDKVEEDGEEDDNDAIKKDKPSKQKQDTAQKVPTQRPRTRSLSNSDSPLAAPGVMIPTKTSPMTRSRVKKDVEFVSLPSTKKRKKGGGGGRWPKRETLSPSPTHETSNKTEISTKQKSDTQTKTAEKQMKSEPDVSEKETDDGLHEESEEAAHHHVPPPKRRRGRPPKRKESLTPTTPTASSPLSSTKGKGGLPGGGGGRGRGKGRSVSRDSTGTADKKGTKLKSETGSSKVKHNSDSDKGESGVSGRSGKSVAVQEDDESLVGWSADGSHETETPLPNKESEAATETTTEKKKKKKERRASADISNNGKSGGKSSSKNEKSTRKSNSCGHLEETEETGDGHVVASGDVVEGEETGGDATGVDSVKTGVGSRGGGSVFVSVLSGPAMSGEEKEGREGEGDEKKEDDVEVESHDPTQKSHVSAGANGNNEEATAQKPPPSHMIQTSYSPTLPYPATTIHPFSSHAAYPYPGPYPPPLMFPGSSNHMYSPHYYPGYPPLPPPPPPTGSGQPMPGAFIPSCPSEPLPPFSATQPLTTVCGVQVSVLDKLPSQLPTILSPHSPHSPHHPMTSQHQISTHTVAMELARHYPQPHPHPLSQAYRPGPAGAHYMPPPHSPYVSVRIDPSGIPFVDWGMPHSHLPPHHPKIEDHNKHNPGKLEPKQEEVPVQSVECPECGRSFKNNKALNGHMRLHGGFDWTKKPFSSGGSHQGTSQQSTASDTQSDNKSHPLNEEKSHSKKSGGSKKHIRSRSQSPARENSKKRRHSNESNVSESEKRSSGDAPSVFTFDTSQMHPSQHAMPPPPSLNTMHDAGTMTGSGTGDLQGAKGATLDDLCRAVEALEKMENGKGCSGNPHGGRESEEDDKRRPENIHIPAHTSPSSIQDRERHRFGSTPPYTPPPILSPARSMAMLATVPGTPSRILQPWSCRRSSDHRKPSEADDSGTSYLEPKINIGRQFQAVLPSWDTSINHTSAVSQQDGHLAEQVWKPLSQPLEEDESVIDGFLELACSPAIQYAGRNKEYALHVLHNAGGSIKEAVRLLLTGKSVFLEDHYMSTYHYSGCKQWTPRERQQFRRAWRVHRKQFHLLKSAVEGKTLPEVNEYYYYWKKYCSDEYRGRNRHISEEIMSDEDMTGPRCLSTDSSSSSSEVEPTTTHLPPENTEKMTTARKFRGAETGPIPRLPMPPHFDLPIVYAPHTSRTPRGLPVQQYKCKYPGCTQVFTSIFALNGHIRIHGGSFYPKADKKDNRSSSPSTGLSSSSTPPHIPSSHSHHPTIHTSVRAGSNGPVKQQTGRPSSASIAAEMRSAQHLEIARALLDLPQPRSPARSVYHTPSPKPSPGSKRSPSGKKKMSSSSPGEHEGYYPCNRCGRVFTKVKSRSAHMKSHIMKPS